ncbi:unnamed protein product [Discula destructiva]
MDAHGNTGPSQAQPTTSAQKAKKQDGPWQPLEDEILKRAIRHHHGVQALEPARDSRQVGTGPLSLKWSDISELCFSNGCKRDAKQCRERWVNHLDPNIEHGQQITEAEGQMLFDLIRQNGRKWAQIGRRMRKPENQLKNYYYQQDKKLKNQNKHHSPRRESRVERQQHQHYAYSQPQPVPASRLLPEPRPSYSSSSTMGSHSRRTSVASNFSNPGLTYDHGSPAESSPRSPHGSFPPHILPPFESKSPSPRAQHSSSMDRSLSMHSVPSVPSTPYDHSMLDSQPMAHQRSEASISTGSHGQPQSSYGGFARTGYTTGQDVYGHHDDHSHYASSMERSDSWSSQAMEYQHGRAEFAAREERARQEQARRGHDYERSVPRTSYIYEPLSAPPTRTTIPYWGHQHQPQNSTLASANPNGQPSSADNDRKASMVMNIHNLLN